MSSWIVVLRWTSGLGPTLTVGAPSGQATMFTSPQTGKIITAQYEAKASFEKRSATVTMKLIRHGDQWQILAFNVNSPQLIPK